VSFSEKLRRDNVRDFHKFVVRMPRVKIPQNYSCHYWPPFDFLMKRDKSNGGGGDLQRGPPFASGQLGPKRKEEWGIMRSPFRFQS
jgi:hypothetical protein